MNKERNVAIALRQHTIDSFLVASQTILHGNGGEYLITFCS